MMWDTAGPVFTWAWQVCTGQGDNLDDRNIGMWQADQSDRNVTAIQGRDTIVYTGVLCQRSWFTTA